MDAVNELCHVGGTYASAATSARSALAVSENQPEDQRDFFPWGFVCAGRFRSYSIVTRYWNAVGLVAELVATRPVNCPAPVESMYPSIWLSGSPLPRWIWLPSASMMTLPSTLLSIQMRVRRALKVAPMRSVILKVRSTRVTAM